MAGVLKQSTKLTGLAVCPNPKYTLDRLYKKVLNTLSKLPESAAYRRHTEEIIKQKSYILNSTDDVNVIEEKIGCGQMEELIQQAKCELNLAQSFLLTRPWERLIAQPPANQWKWPPK